jgi:hypothetical protein
MTDLPGEPPQAEPETLLARLRRLDAELVRPPWLTWLGKHGYPQRVVANNDGLSLIAETYNSPDVPSIDADGIALMRNALPALLRVVEAAEALAETWRPLGDLPDPLLDGPEEYALRDALAALRATA